MRGDKRAMVVQHVAVETLAENLMQILQGQGFHLAFQRVFESAPRYDTFDPPPIDQVDLLIVLGGPFSANDAFPALQREREYIGKALESEVPVFGICLGAQLMAKVLGGRVEPTGGYQFGLRKIHVTTEGDVDPVFGKIDVPLVPTLHGDCFTTPPGAVKLADGHILRRDGTYRKIDMAFAYGNSYGFQFEPQLTLAEFRAWNRELKGDYRLMGPDFDPEEEASRNEREFAKYAPLHESQMRRMFTAFLEKANLI